VRVGRPPWPVVVGLSAVVAAFSLENVFVRPGEITMPGQEVAIRSVRVKQVQWGRSTHPVPWIDKVWLMCVATRSSYLFFAPAAMPVGVLAGSFARHCTASMYAFFSSSQSVDLKLSVDAFSNDK
jgi:hypothetical protein